MDVLAYRCEWNHFLCYDENHNEGKEYDLDFAGKIVEAINHDLIGI
jgi:hypothetical protein